MSSSGNKKNSDHDTAKQAGSGGAGQSGNIKGSKDKSQGGSSDTGKPNKGGQSGTKNGNGSGKFTVLFSF